MAKPTFKANPIQVQVPASSANLGPGFDSFGLALGMHDRYVAQILDDAGLDIDVTGEGADEVPRTDKNLLVKAMYKGFDFLGGKPKGIAVRALKCDSTWTWAWIFGKCDRWRFITCARFGSHWC
jgi:homoserine kinase